MLLAVWFWFWPTAEATERRWREQAGFDPLGAYPHAEANATARRIEDLVAPLGLELAPPDAPRRARPEPETAERIAAAQVALRKHLRELRRREPVLQRPPELVESLLAEAEPVLEQVVALLASAEPPRWEVALERGIEAPAPNLTGHLGLHHLLVASAAEAARRQDGDRALERLEAAWLVRESGAEHPLLISQLIALAELTDTLALLRALDQPLPGWEQRLESMPLRQRIATGMHLDSWVFVRSLRIGQLTEIAGERPLQPLYRPLARHGVAAYVDFMEHGMARLEGVDVRSFDETRFFAEEYARIPRWNVVARILAPNFFAAWVRAARGELNVELTRRTIELRRLLRTGDATTLESLAGEHASVVDGIRWSYRFDRDAVVIEASDVPAEVENDPLPLAIRVTR